MYIIFNYIVLLLFGLFEFKFLYELTVNHSYFETLGPGSYRGFDPFPRGPMATVVALQ